MGAQQSDDGQRPCAGARRCAARCSSRHSPPALLACQGGVRCEAWPAAGARSLRSSTPVDGGCFNAHSSASAWPGRAPTGGKDLRVCSRAASPKVACGPLRQRSFLSDRGTGTSSSQAVMLGQAPCRPITGGSQVPSGLSDQSMPAARSCPVGYCDTACTVYCTRLDKTRPRMSMAPSPSQEGAGRKHVASRCALSLCPPPIALHVNLRPLAPFEHTSLECSRRAPSQTSTLPSRRLALLACWPCYPRPATSV